ncbi:spinster family MFS transporter [Brevundimonas sp.]|uniref:spinster family MFS transporter n=1 Tax=Brevundimonas sp. TaxID=1871086 RepID=UPI003D122E75
MTGSKPRTPASSDAKAEANKASIDAVAADPPATGKAKAYAAYVLFVLILANMLSSIDRSIVNILVEPIRADLGFSDTQMGAIGGLGFALFYGLLGLPIARLADKYSRKRILAVGMVVWSAMTMLTGRAVGFWTMLIPRIGVGAGEATLYPTGLSLIGDYFARHNRPRAIGLFQVGVHLGIIVGAAIAGVVAEKHGWRHAFFLLGAPGLILALVLMVTVREPERGRLDRVVGKPPLTDTFATMAGLLTGNRPLLLLVLGSALMSVAAATLANWGAAYLIRSHGLTLSQVGLTVGPVLGLGGAIGTVVGGFVGSWVAKRSSDPYAPLKVILWTALPAAPFMTLFLMAPTMPLVVVGGLCGGLLTAMHYGPLVAVAIGLAPAAHRAMAGALMILGQTVLGFGFGPLIAGGLSDLLAPGLGTEALRYAMLIAPASVVGAWICAGLARRMLIKSSPDTV